MLKNLWKHGLTKGDLDNGDDDDDDYDSTKLLMINS
jgi:hypothetical protein